MMLNKYKPIILEESHYLKILSDLNENLVADGLVAGSAFYFIRKDREYLIAKGGSLEGNLLKIEILKESGGHLGYWYLYKAGEFSLTEQGFFQVLSDLLSEAMFFEEWEFDHSFTQNRGCRYFPCHEIADEREFSCLFCYCPLYFIPDCGGDFQILDNGIKDCSLCTIPHEKINYEYIVDKLKVNM